MIKDLLLTVILIASSFVLGLAVDYRYLLSVKSLGSAGNLLGGPVVGINKVIEGKVINVSGKLMTVEYKSQRATIRMGNEVSITTIAFPAGVSGLEATPSGTLPPKMFKNFVVISVGSQVTAYLDMQPGGDFLVNAIFLKLAGNKTK